MAASLATAIKAYIEAGSLGAPVFRDAVPATKTDGTPQDPPYVIVTDGIADVPDAANPDAGRGAVKTTEQVQVDIYEHIRDSATNTQAESYALAKAVMRRLNGAKLPAAPERVYGVRVFNRFRVRDDDNNLVRNTLTLNVKRAL